MNTSRSATTCIVPAASDSGWEPPGSSRRTGCTREQQQAAAEEVAARIREAGLRTVRIILVDQHGLPRRSTSPARPRSRRCATASDFSGAIYSLDTGNCVFPPAFAEGGGFGIDEFTGFPDVAVVPDPTTFRILPWADRTGWMLCDAYFSNGRPLPLDGRAQLRNQLGRLERGRLRATCRASRSSSTSRATPTRAASALDETGQPGPAPEVDVVQRGYQFLSDARLDGVGDTLEAIRDGLWDVGLPPRSIEDEWGPGPVRVHVQPAGGARRGRLDDPVPQRDEGHLRAPRPAGVVHVLAGAPELLPVRLAPAPVARRHRDRRERVRRTRRELLSPVGHAVRRRPARPRARR